MYKRVEVEFIDGSDFKYSRLLENGDAAGVESFNSSNVLYILDSTRGIELCFPLNNIKMIMNIK